MRPIPTKYLLLLTSLSSILLLSCLVTDLLPTATPSPADLRAEATRTMTATSTAVATPIPDPTHTATAPVPSPTLSTPEPPGETYIIDQERRIGEYVVRLWRNTAPEGIGYDNIATISGAGQPEVRVEFAAALGEETGTDLTGEGHPDVVIEVFTGGAHCCLSTIVYDLGPTLTKVLETPLSNCGGSFQDLDGDGIAEYVTCDDLFAYVYCCYAGSPAARVVLRYDPGSGYVPASPQYGDIYAGPIGADTEIAENAEPGERCEWDETTRCGVLPLVLDLLYAGQDAQAWAELDRLYPYPDVLLFWAEIVQAVSSSPLYVPSGAKVDVPYPPYYMLYLRSGCGGDMQYVVGVLGEGQPTCDQEMPRRDLYWLQIQLQDAGLLAEGEMLMLAPDGCPDACRLDVIRIADNAQVGIIRLDVQAGFPGEVYRIGETESAHWRLRGDLTWERVGQ